MARYQVIEAVRIESKILTVRGLRVLRDADLAQIYGVSVKRLNEQVRRNFKRFPSDFAFQVLEDEWDSLRSQNATSKGRGGRRYLPWVFTEHGALMLASILNSDRAVEMSVSVVRAFVLMREQLATHKELAKKLCELESCVSGHDESIQQLFEAVRQLVEPPVSNKGPVGFCQEETTPYRVKVKSKKRF